MKLAIPEGLKNCLKSCGDAFASCFSEFYSCLQYLFACKCVRKSHTSSPTIIHVQPASSIEADLPSRGSKRNSGTGELLSVAIDRSAAPEQWEITGGIVAAPAPIIFGPLSSEDDFFGEMLPPDASPTSSMRNS